jgi:hypothetical protein
MWGGGFPSGRAPLTGAVVSVLAVVLGALQLLLDAAPDPRFDRAEILFLFEEPVCFEDPEELDRQGRDVERCVDPVAFGTLPPGGAGRTLVLHERVAPREHPKWR